MISHSSKHGTDRKAVVSTYPAPLLTDGHREHIRQSEELAQAAGANEVPCDI